MTGSPPAVATWPLPRAPISSQEVAASNTQTRSVTTLNVRPIQGLCV
eukprot:CAMPEP_0198576340 /NCGR_PEP_ID=MMETSP1462-20131121/117447_1 /TAXON_ID=1333877 /ORGANISM="Brandtodinium nutriculum, Strain RCC3387" /LENGTH=46 /DNA_ID= /DNA_START= /DNA_END= /DNA_ORIENTATION=